MFLSFLLSVFAFRGAFASPFQVPLQNNQTDVRILGELHGRMLHITDMHPDPHYVPHTSKKSACHRMKGSKGSGYYGTPHADCDSPLILTNFTLDYLEAEWASEIDFVVWTGDNARHDNDEEIPRTPEEIKELNAAVAAKMKKIFLGRGIPVIPSIGNNDVWPHNTMEPGPNAIIHAFSSIWEGFIPQGYMDVFRRGAYFSVEVIPHEVAVISLNTLYFFDSNDAVNGCPYTEPGDAGNQHFDWLQAQLKMYRDRGMHVWLIGHVPPSPGNYYAECYVRYVEIALRYQDTILGHLFGHMNVDFFYFLDRADLEIISGRATAVRATTLKGDDLFDTLMDEFSALPESLGKINLDDFAVVNVSPSVVPNPYVPGFRIYSYNVTRQGPGREKAFKKRKHGHGHGRNGDKEVECGKDKWRDSWKYHLPNETWHSDAESPSRSNQQWTPLGYAQFYVPKLDKANERQEPRFELEYLSFKAEELYRTELIPLKRLPRQLEKYTPYGMEDLTIRSWIKLASRMGHRKDGKLRRNFRQHMYLGQE